MTSIVLLVAAVGGVILGSAMPSSEDKAKPDARAGIAAYILSVVLFATGAFGVLIRRSPLIILLALELMLNAGNLALIAFAGSSETATDRSSR